MNPELCVVMATYYDLTNPADMFRFGLAQRTLLKLRLLIDAGAPYRAIVVDTSPQPIVASSFRNLGAIVLRSDPGIGPQTQTGVAYAQAGGVPFVLKTDPEKYGLIEADFLAQILAYLREDLYDIVCVQRARDLPHTGFSSLPAYQQETESDMSQALAALGLPADTPSGIQAMNQPGMLNWLSFDPQTHGKQWEILWFTLLDGLLKGLRIGGLALPFPHPIEMVLFEEGWFERDPRISAEIAQQWRQKRDYQRELIIPKVTAYAATLAQR